MRLKGSGPNADDIRKLAAELVNAPGGLAFLDLNASKRPQEYKRRAKNGDSQQAKHHYCHPRNLS